MEKSNMESDTRNMIRTTYWSAHTDQRKLALFALRDLWKVIAGIVCGAAAGVLIYFVYHAIADGTVYTAYSQFYLDFAFDEAGEAYDYYNGYTWNDLMTTDPIADLTLQNLGSEFDVSRLEQDTRADILSDIRVLKVSFTESDERSCTDVQNATEKALMTFGENAKEFTQISVIKSVKPTLQVADNRILQAIILGAIAGFVISLIALWFMYILDDKITVPSDMDGLDIPVRGVKTAASDEKLEARLNAVFSGSESAQDEDMTHIDASAYQDPDAGLEGILSASGSVVIDVPYRRVTRTMLKLMRDRLTASGVDVAGCMITDADASFLRKYYSFAPKG